MGVYVGMVCTGNANMCAGGGKCVNGYADARLKMVQSVCTDNCVLRVNGCVGSVGVCVLVVSIWGQEGGRLHQ